MNAVFSVVEIVHAIEPRVFARAERVRFAIAQLQAGIPRREVSGMVRRRFQLSAMQSWRIVQMALDLADPSV